MTTPTDPQHRTAYQPTADQTRLTVNDDDGMMELRLPVASTGEVRNDGDDPLSRSEIDGMARQINERAIGVFQEHGGGMFGGYNQLEKMGVWQNGEVDDTRDGEADLLVATARMPDPDTLPDATGPYKEALSIYKVQAERGVPLEASIGWREDEDMPGGNDLMEVSIVGIGADPRTNTDNAQAVARAAVAAGADRDALVDAVAREVRNLDDPQFSEGDKVQWSFDDTPVHGRVAGIHEQYTPPELDDPIVGDDGEAVYSIHQYEDEQDELSDTANVAKPESSLSPSDVDMPTLDSTNSMTDDDEPDAGTTDNEQDTPDGGGELREVSVQDFDGFVAAHQDGADVDDISAALDEISEWVGGLNLGELALLASNADGVDMEPDEILEALGVTGEQGDDMDDEDEDEDDEDEQAADPDTEQDGDVDELRDMIERQSEELDDLRSEIVNGEADLTGGEPEGEQEADEPDDEQNADDNRAADGPDWRA